MAYPTITALPDAPQRTQSPDAFATTADTFVAALPDLVTEVNAAGVYIEERSLYVGNDFQGAYAAGTTYSKGQSVSDGGLYYISLVDSNIGNTPASSPSQWSELNVVLGAGEITKNAGEDLTAGQAVYLNQSGTLSGISTQTITETFGTLVEGLASGTNKTGGLSMYDPTSNSYIYIYDIGNTAYLRLITLEEDGTYTLSSEVTLTTTLYNDANGFDNAILYDEDSGKYRFFYKENNAQYPEFTSFTIDSSGTVTVVNSAIRINGTSSRMITSRPSSIAYNETLGEYVLVYIANTGSTDMAHTIFTISSSDVVTVLVSDVSLGTVSTQNSHHVMYLPWTGEVWMFYYSGTASTVNARTLASTGNGTVNNMTSWPEETLVAYDIDENKEIITFVSVDAGTDHLAAQTVSVSGGTATVLNYQEIVDTGVTTEDFNNWSITDATWSRFGFAKFSQSDGQAERYVFVYTAKTGTSYDYVQTSFTVSDSGTITIIEQAQDFWMNDGIKPIAYEMELMSHNGEIKFVADENTSGIFMFTYTPAHTYETNSRFLGFTESTVTSGNSVVVNTIGGTNENQSGLLTGVSYYVSTSGGLETLSSATNFGPVATAISATDVIVKA